MTLIAFALGALVASGCIWLGFRLGRLSPDTVPAAPSLPESFEGAILDLAVYPDEVADE